MMGSRNRREKLVGKFLEQIQGVWDTSENLEEKLEEKREELEGLK